MKINQIEELFINNLAEYVRNNALQEQEKDIKTYLDLQEKISCVCMLEVESQYPVGIYIIDFYFWDALTNQKYAVEIDGHEAHKTKEQRFNDYRRERFLMKEGYKVIRFMGSEVYTDAGGCIKELMEIIDIDRKQYERLEQAFGIQEYLSNVGRGEFDENYCQNEKFRNSIMNKVQLAYDIFSYYQFERIVALFAMLGLDWKEFVRFRR